MTEAQRRRVTSLARQNQLGLKRLVSPPEGLSHPPPPGAPTRLNDHLLPQSPGKHGASRRAQSRRAVRVLRGCASSADVLDCMTAYSPPAERLIIRRGAGPARHRHGVTLKRPPTRASGRMQTSTCWRRSARRRTTRAACDGRRGRWPAETLAKVLMTGQQVLCGRHLAQDDGEQGGERRWRWIDEAGCVMHGRTSPPSSAPPCAPSSASSSRCSGTSLPPPPAAASKAPRVGGNLIIFDMDLKDVKQTGNTNVFCKVRPRVCSRAHASRCCAGEPRTRTRDGLPAHAAGRLSL